MAHRGFGAGFSTPFYAGGEVVEALATSFVTDLSLGDHDYMIDWKSEIPLRLQSIPTIKQQQDDSETVSEHSLNPEGLWRRGGESWHLGAGQLNFDRKDSSEFRFDVNFGLDTWTKNEFTLLPGTEGKVLSGNSNLILASTGTRLYMTNGAALGYYSSLSAGFQALTNVTGHPANAASSMATDGFHVWTAHQANGVYRTDTGVGAMASQINAGTVNTIAYVRNRLMAATNNLLYEVTAAGFSGAPPVALPAVLFTHPNTNFVWKSFAEGSGFIYAAGYAGDKSLIYKIALTQEGTVLGAPTVAAEPPVGEQVECIYGYLGRFLFIGTNKGWRFAIVGGNGDLELGVLTKTTYTVKCAVGEGPFIYFGCDTFTNGIDAQNYVGMSRLSTEFFVDVDGLQPAWANDSMVALASANGGTASIATFLGRKFFTTNGIGLTAVFDPNTGNLMPFGYLDTGQVTFNMTEPKKGIWFDHFHTGIGTFRVFASVNGSTFTQIGEHVVAVENEQMPSFALGDVEGKQYAFRIELVPDTDPTKGLTFKSWLFRAQPEPNITSLIWMTILMAPTLLSLEETQINYDTWAEQAYLELLQAKKTIVSLRIGRQFYQVMVEDYDDPVHSLMYEREGFTGHNSSITIKTKRVDNVGNEE